jgi:hypothetical protein|tara:strand:+ start:243 stop:401 length:159 start_codon:yes stop_codon:yes gene_type:complete
MLVKKGFEFSIITLLFFFGDASNTGEKLRKMNVKKARINKIQIGYLIALGIL